jgi:hypothetical protein
MRTRTGEKPFSCNVCDYACTTAGSLRGHIRIPHWGEALCMQAVHQVLHCIQPPQAPPGDPH